MDLWPSFSQPNVRENQPLKMIAANFIAIRSQASLSEIVGRMLLTTSLSFVSFLNPAFFCTIKRLAT